MATNRAIEVDAVAVLFLAVTWITSGLRCYVKVFIAKSFGIEDWLAMLAQTLFTLTACFALKGISHSMGKHLLEISFQDLAPAMMYWFSTELAYTMTTGILKLSIAVFLLRIATQKSHRIILYTIIVLVSLLTVAYFFFLVFQCKPVSYFWLQFNGKKGSCIAPATVGAMTYAHSGINAFCDVVLALLPIIIVLQLQMNIRTKLIVSTILSMGIIAAIAVIIRIPYVKILVDNASDFLYSSTDVVIWTAIEPGLAISAANMATLRPLFQAFLSHTKLFGGTSARTGREASGYGGGLSSTRSRGLRGMERKWYLSSGSRGNHAGRNDTETGCDGDGDEVGLRDLRFGVEDEVEVESEKMDTGVESYSQGGLEGHIHGSTESGGKAWDRERDLERGVTDGERDRDRDRLRRNRDTVFIGRGGEGRERRGASEWPINVTRTVQTQVTSWRADDGEDAADLGVGVGVSKNGRGTARRRSVSRPWVGATSQDW